MIVNFRHRGLKRLFDNDERSKLPQDMVARIAIILADLDVAERIEDMNRPNFRLHSLKGNLRGFHAVTVRANWRIIFRFKDGDAFDVDFVDYR